ncbi:MAG: mitochondrial fission ELM1 family protein [Fuerstia sp.]|nr:mitochondrial fission ELM1 family protein [Fuerstiella sp.]
MLRSTESPSDSAVIWRLLDGRSGHENQVIGLTEAISRTRAVHFFDIYINQSLRGLRSLIPGRLSFAESLPAPDLLIGAGHATHLPMLASQKRFGGKTVVVMKPSLPTALFDLCLIPAHDNLMFQPGNVVRTEGALNRIRPSAEHDSGKGLLLIGGPSKHFLWSNDAVVDQIRDVVQQRGVCWTVATSERTPDSFIRRWRTEAPEIPLVTAQECSSDWLPERLAQCGVVWVTCDSMSMIYESLTAGTRVGLLELPVIRRDRITRNIQRLCGMGWGVTSRQWLAGHKLPTLNRQFSESDRCSAIVMDRLLRPSSSLSTPPRKQLPDFLPAQAAVCGNAGARPADLGTLMSMTSMPVR